MANEFTQDDRRRFYDLYIKMVENLSEVDNLLRCCLDPYRMDQEKAYWYAGISSGLNTEIYYTMNPTFEKFLLTQGIMNDEGEFVEYDEEEEDEDEEG